MAYCAKHILPETKDNWFVRGILGIMENKYKAKSVIGHIMSTVVTEINVFWCTHKEI